MLLKLAEENDVVKNVRNMYIALRDYVTGYFQWIIHHCSFTFCNVKVTFLYIYIYENTKLFEMISNIVSDKGSVPYLCAGGSIAKEASVWELPENTDCKYCWNETLEPVQR